MKNRHIENILKELLYTCLYAKQQNSVIFKSDISRIISEVTGGSHPDEFYKDATRASLYLDRPTSHGGWPEGEYDPPINDVIYNYLKSMGLIKENKLQ